MRQTGAGVRRAAGFEPSLRRTKDSVPKIGYDDGRSRTQQQANIAAAAFSGSV